MIRELFTVALIATGIATTAPVLANAGDCTGWVVGVRPPGLYNHNRGNGFLAVRNGPGSRYQQIGEVYLGDEISVWNRRGRWYQIACMSGICTRPYWGRPSPQGWVHGRYLSIDGVCP